jgi:hypothetical protein
VGQGGTWRTLERIPEAGYAQAQWGPALKHERGPGEDQCCQGEHGSGVVTSGCRHVVCQAGGAGEEVGRTKRAYGAA